MSLFSFSVFLRGLEFPFYQTNRFSCLQQKPVKPQSNVLFIKNNQLALKVNAAGENHVRSICLEGNNLSNFAVPFRIVLLTFLKILDG